MNHTDKLVNADVYDLVKIELDWDKASEYVEAVERDAIEKVRDSLTDLMENSSCFDMDYLPTHYFDRAGRYQAIRDDVFDGLVYQARDAMISAMVTYHAHKALYGSTVAWDAYTKWVKGDHDT